MDSDISPHKPLPKNSRTGFRKNTHQCSDVYFSIRSSQVNTKKNADIFSKVHLCEWMTNPLTASGTHIRKGPRCLLPLTPHRAASLAPRWSLGTAAALVATLDTPHPSRHPPRLTAPSVPGTHHHLLPQLRTAEGRIQPLRHHLHRQRTERRRYQLGKPRRRSSRHLERCPTRSSGTCTVPGLAAPEAWKTTQGAGVTVAVIDSGIVKHPDLDANVVPGHDFITEPAIARDGNDRDSNPTDQGNWEEAGVCDAGGTEAVVVAVDRPDAVVFGDNVRGVSMMFWPNLLLAKALRSRVALLSLMSATKETTASSRCRWCWR